MSLVNARRLLGLRDRTSETRLRAINARRQELGSLRDDELRVAARRLAIGSPEIRKLEARKKVKPDLEETFALAAVIAERVLGLRMFDVQLLGALALAGGHIAEMQTGEGKTLAAVPAVTWFALQGRGVHVLTVNDYLARRDASWMGAIYGWFGLAVGHVSQDMSADERRTAYRCDVTYAMANEVGFDYLRDGMARSKDELVHRPFAFAVIDEADSILIDEARIPLVIAAGVPDDPKLAYRIDGLIRGLVRHADYRVDQFSRIVQLTDLGIRRVELELRCGNLFEEKNYRILTAVQDALHAHVLLKRNVDYVVKNSSIELVDEFKGRIAQNRRWPAGLQSAIEAKEGLGLKQQGRIFGSITIQALAGLYEHTCGMTGTAATQAEEFWKVYKLPVTVIPPNRPIIRQDLNDIVYADKVARNRAVVEEIRKVHRTGRPILVGTASVDESERLSRYLVMAGIPHSVLNAKNDEAEAAIVAQAGALGAVTISTNMAGRGTDILLGGVPPRDRERVLELGGLYVIGTTRYEARRIDNQLRGRAGRQGDPGTSRFFISLEDDLLVKFGIATNPDIESVQRTAESQGLETRQLLWKYESVIEYHRREIQDLRRKVLASPEWSVGSLIPDEQYQELLSAVGKTELDRAARRLTLHVIDDLWADYLANISELRGGIHWVQWGGRDPLYEFLNGVEEIHADFWVWLKNEVAEALMDAEIRNGSIRFQNEECFERGATWTYMTTDQPFGSLQDRILKALMKAVRR